MFGASGRTITFPGFLRAYVETVDAEAGGEADDAERRLPNLTVGQQLDIRELIPASHVTTPPARYTEPSLIGALQDLGIGRPSTYTSIIRTIIDRGYVWKKGQALVPSWIAFAVIGLLEQHFARLVDYDFTAAMEDELDAIADGRIGRTDWLGAFYFGGDVGPGGLGRPDRWAEEAGRRPARGHRRPRGQLAAAADRFRGPAGAGPGRPVRAVPGARRAYDDGEGTRAAGATCPRTCRRTRSPPRSPRSCSPRPAISDRNSASTRTPATSSSPRTAGTARTSPRCSRPEDAPDARARPAVKPRTASLFKSMTLDTIDLPTRAAAAVAAPGGRHRPGRRRARSPRRTAATGPYLKKGTDSRSLATEDALFDVTLEEALALYAQPKQRGRSAAAAPPLREVGADPSRKKPMVIKDGRFGPYVTDGETNASLRKGDEVETLTVERAAELLADRRARGPAPKRATARKAAAQGDDRQDGPGRREDHGGQDHGRQDHGGEDDGGEDHGQEGRTAQGRRPEPPPEAYSRRMSTQRFVDALSGADGTRAPTVRYDVPPVYPDATVPIAPVRPTAVTPTTVRIPEIDPRIAAAVSETAAADRMTADRVRAPPGRTSGRRGRRRHRRPAAARRPGPGTTRGPPLPRSRRRPRPVTSRRRPARGSASGTERAGRPGPRPRRPARAQLRRARQAVRYRQLRTPRGGSRRHPRPAAGRRSRQRRSSRPPRGSGRARAAPTPSRSACSCCCSVLLVTGLGAQIVDAVAELLQR